MPFGKKSIESSVATAVSEVGTTMGVIRAKSKFYATPAFPAGSGPDFINAAVAVETAMSPQAFLAGLHGIEASFGRDRSQRWGPRTLDLDLVAFDDLVHPDIDTYQKWAQLSLDEQMKRAPDGLILPHPRLAERAFVLVPLADVAPEWRHPVTNVSVREMLHALPEHLLAEVAAVRAA